MRILKPISHKRLGLDALGDSSEDTVFYSDRLFGSPKVCKTHNIYETKRNYSFIQS